MRYKRIKKGVFVSRPNRFIAKVEVDGEIKLCHVKNTGRCKELLIPGSIVILEGSDDPSRKTEFDLVSVYKGNKLINIDSQAPNKLFYEWIEKSGFFGDASVRPECFYKNSRFDFYIESEERKIFAEIKGATLEDDGVVMFPDAPTERGLKHLRELEDALSSGYDTYVFFIVQMSGAKYFTPNVITHREFAEELKKATEVGVQVFALDCVVTEEEIVIHDFMNIIL